MADRILLVEDDPRLAEMLSEYSGSGGFSRHRRDRWASSALEQLSGAEFDAVVLDSDAAGHGRPGCLPAAARRNPTRRC
jgi:DNA-binding response OmpR family regulator